MRQKIVLVAELLIVGLFLRFVAVVVRERFGAQQPCLTEEDSFNLKQIITVFINGAEGNGACPGVEGFAVDAKAEGTGNGSKEGIVPVLLVLLVAFQNLRTAHLQPLEQQGREPAVDGQLRKVAHNVVAGRVVFFLEQGFITPSDGIGDREYQLGNELPVTAVDGGVALANNMEDDGVVALVLVVVVEEPVRCLHVEFHVACPLRAVDDNFGAREVRPRVGIGEAGVNNFDGKAVDGLEGRERKQAVFPDVAQQFFHGVFQNLGKNSGFLAKIFYLCGEKQKKQ